ncbi:MAG TPA: TMEM175 family protein [Rhodopila sp.]|uniref:TMEM175 family protein n=1 Tax=Rhodopila sp. TaxID=2480087 RepID=UPI002BC141CB|nr:TMEM175 family protein [Rhodopila sp.]HVY17867.1 TMEM175 family protein [Rhodopila sp.]
MPTHYNAIAGQSVERLAALSDGLFAVAMTLLVLDLKVPAAEAIRTEASLVHALGDLAPRLLVYLMSFITLGIFWVGQQTQLNHLARGDRYLTWIHLGFLFAVTLMPFSTSLMAELIGLRVALVTYWLNILALGVLLYIAWRYARTAQLVREQVDAVIDGAMRRRIVVAQVLYAIGAALCVINTYCSIGFIMVVQLIYVVGPRRGILARM